MKFTIIITAYRRYDKIKCLLYSLMSQTYKNFEIILIHDGIDQKHEQVINSFLSSGDLPSDINFKYIQSPVRYDDWGMSLRNIGLEIASGDFIINTNDDNYYTPNWLSEIVNVLNLNPNVNFVYYDMVLSHNNIENHNKKDYGLFIPQLKHSYIDMGQFTVKREVIQKYRFNLSAPADGELIEEMLHELNPFYINKILFVHN